MIGHAKSSCKHQTLHNQIADDDDMYGPWVKAEADEYTMVLEGSYLWRVEIPRGEIFDTFFKEVNTDRQDDDENKAEFTKPVEGDRVEEHGPAENRVDPAEIESMKGVRTSPVKSIVKSDTSYQSYQILGMENQFQNPVW